MSVPFDRTGEPVVVELGERVLTGARAARRAGGFRLRA